MSDPLIGTTATTDAIARAIAGDHLEARIASVCPLCPRPASRPGGCAASPNGTGGAVSGRALSRGHASASVPSPLRSPGQDLDIALHLAINLARPRPLLSGVVEMRQRAVWERQWAS